MAQYFLPLYLARPGEWPAAFVGNVPSVSHEAIAYLGPGVNGATNSPEFVKRGVSGASNIASTCLLGISAGDYDVLYKARLSQHAGSTTVSGAGPIAVCARASYSGSGLTGLPTDCYMLSNGQSTTLGSGSLQRSLYLFKRAGGTLTQIGSTASNVLSNPGSGALDWENAPPVLMRLQCIGTTIRGRMWYEGDSEPGSWNISTTDSDVASGDVGFTMWNYGNKCSASWLSVGTGSDSALAVPERVVSGVVLQPNSSPADGYRVNLHDQLTGVLLASGLTDSSGEFSFTINSTMRVYVVAVDQLGNTWRAQIADRINPATP